MAAEPDESNWRITMGFGLLEHCPLSPERKEINRREAEREARAAEFEAEQRRTAASSVGGNWSAKASRRIATRMCWRG
jgi:hypothetical protein